MVAAVAAADDNGAVRVERDFTVRQPDMFVADELIVVLTADARRAAAVGVDQSGAPVVNLPDLQDVIDRNGVTRFARQFPTAQPQPVESKFHDLTGYYKVKIGPGATLDDTLAAFTRNPRVDHVEKIGIHPVFGCATGTPLTPNDTWYDNPPPTFAWPQWDLWDVEGIDADLAWSIETGDESVVVVGMDSGVRYIHADLGGPDAPGPGDNVTNGNVWVNPYEIPNNGIDDDGNGRIDDVVGWDFVTGVTGCSAGEDCNVEDNDPRDFNGHGTHTAGTMAAITNNASGIAGIAGGFGNGTTGAPGDGSKIMCMRIGWSTPLGGFVRMDFAAQAMNYVTDMKLRGVNVAAVNASWGSSNSGGIDAAVDNLLAAEVMLIHAAGNSNADSPGYLGNKAGVMNVAATDQNGNRASFSNFGSWVDIAAPGVDIISTYHNNQDPANDYVAVMSGTSMSAPHVAGVAALLESCNPSLSGPDKFNIMVSSGCAAGSANIGDILNAKLALDAAGCGGGGCSSDPECDDGNVCNGAETCDLGSGTCQAGTPLSCNDGNACTADACDPGTGCSNDPIDCDDGSACTADSCDTLIGCINDPIAPCCGNGTCELGEDCTTCSTDCISGTTSGAVCGNGLCEAGDGEDCVSCPDDCNGKQNGRPTNRFCCGDGDGQNPLPCGDATCSTGGWSCTDTPASSGSYCCGNLTCEGAEDFTNCDVDCDAPFCGDGSCDPGEDQCTCEADCGSPPPTETNCSDGVDNDCDGMTDVDDPDCDCGLRGDACSTGADCCSGNCKRNGTCR